MLGQDARHCRYCREHDRNDDSWEATIQQRRACGSAFSIEKSMDRMRILAGTKSAGMPHLDKYRPSFQVPPAAIRGALCRRDVDGAWPKSGRTLAIAISAAMLGYEN